MPSNERLEFLGDAVLGIAVTAYIYENYPAMSEGELAQLRAALVNATVLAAVGDQIGLGEFIHLGKGEAASGGASKPSIIADALEAVLASIYLDGGMDAASEVVLGLLDDRIQTASQGHEIYDAKTRLQEYVARSIQGLPVYEITEDGPDHAKMFEAKVFVGDTLTGSGSGRSKKQAEQQAAYVAWNYLTRQSNDVKSDHHDA